MTPLGPQNKTPHDIPRILRYIYIYIFQHLQSHSPNLALGTSAFLDLICCHGGVNQKNDSEEGQGKDRLSRSVHMGVSKNRGGPPKSSILIRFPLINHPFWGTTIFGNAHIFYFLNPRQITQLKVMKRGKIRADTRCNEYTQGVFIKKYNRGYGLKHS